MLGKEIKGMSATEVLREIFAVFVGNLMYGKVTGASIGQQSAPAPQGTGEQRRKFINWFSNIFSGLSSRDEAAFLEALSCLTPAEWSVMGMRLKALGDPAADDTPEARAFRQAVVLIPDFETRVAVLKKAVSLPEGDWLVIASASGAAVAGQLNRAWCLIRDHYGPNFLEKAKAADTKIAAAVQAWDPILPLRQITDKMEQWRLKSQEERRRLEAERGPWRRLGEFFGILRPTCLGPGILSREWHGFVESFKPRESHPPFADQSVSGTKGENGQVP